MDRHLLVAISNDVKALHGVKFVSEFFDDLSKIKVTLFSSMPSKTPEWEPGSNAQNPTEMRAILAKLNASFQTAIAEARSILEKAGMPPENIEQKSEVCVRSMDFHLALEAAGENYGALVLGRKGLDSLYQLFEKSLTERLFRTGLKLPCWACRRYEPGRRNILLCIDKSPSLTNLVDHVAKICDWAQGHNITLFHVCSLGQNSNEINAIFNEAIEQLTSQGIPSSRIKVLFSESPIPAQAILREAKEGRYAAVAVCRQGEPKNWFNKIFTGSTCSTLLNDLKGAALWFTD